MSTIEREWLIEELASKVLVNHFTLPFGFAAKLAIAVPSVGIKRFAYSDETTKKTAIVEIYDLLFKPTYADRVQQSDYRILYSEKLKSLQNADKKKEKEDKLLIDSGEENGLGWILSYRPKT